LRWEFAGYRFVGRETLEIFNQALQKARAGRGQVVALVRSPE
jgi:hypothetical protein